MKPVSLLLAAFIILTSASFAYRPSHPQALAHPVALVPSSILWGIARAESDFNPRAVSPDGRDLGMFQLRSNCAWECDPFDPIQATKMAEKILSRNRAELGSWNMAITGYRWGIRGARAHGVDKAYVRKVIGE